MAHSICYFLVHMWIMCIYRVLVKALTYGSSYIMSIFFNKIQNKCVDFIARKVIDVCSKFKHLQRHYIVLLLEKVICSLPTKYLKLR